MGILKWFARSKPASPKLVAGSFTVDPQCRVMTATVGSDVPKRLLEDTAREVLSLFRAARAAQMPLAGLDLQFAGLCINAVETQAGAIIYLTPQNAPADPSPAEKDSP